MPYQGYTVFHFGEHRAAPTEISFHWEVNFKINLRVILLFIFLLTLLSLAYYIYNLC